MQPYFNTESTSNINWIPPPIEYNFATTEHSYVWLVKRARKKKNWSNTSGKKTLQLNIGVTHSLCPPLIIKKRSNLCEGGQFLPNKTRLSSGNHSRNTRGCPLHAAPRRTSASGLRRRRGGGTSPGRCLRTGALARPPLPPPRPWGGEARPPGSPDGCGPQPTCSGCRAAEPAPRLHSEGQRRQPPSRAPRAAARRAGDAPPATRAGLPRAPRLFWAGPWAQPRLDPLVWSFPPAHGAGTSRGLRGQDQRPSCCKGKDRVGREGEGRGKQGAPAGQGWRPVALFPEGEGSAAVDTLGKQTPGCPGFHTRPAEGLGGRAHLSHLRGLPVLLHWSVYHLKSLAFLLL